VVKRHAGLIGSKGGSTFLYALTAETPACTQQQHVATSAIRASNLSATCALVLGCGAPTDPKLHSVSAPLEAFVLSPEEKKAKQVDM
jgi:hypothetical protein